MSGLPAQGRRCQCEHESHLLGEDPTAHGYLEAPAGALSAYFVGPVCDECARGHCAPYLRHTSNEGVAA